MTTNERLDNAVGCVCLFGVACFALYYFGVQRPKECHAETGNITATQVQLATVKKIMWDDVANNGRHVHDNTTDSDDYRASWNRTGVEGPLIDSLTNALSRAEIDLTICKASK